MESKEGNEKTLVSVEDLHHKVRLYGRAFITFSIAFYVSVPILYYWAALGWQPLDSFYVRLSLLSFTVLIIFVLIVLCGDVHYCWLRRHNSNN